MARCIPFAWLSFDAFKRFLARVAVRWINGFGGKNRSLEKAANLCLKTQKWQESRELFVAILNQSALKDFARANAYIGLAEAFAGSGDNNSAKEQLTKAEALAIITRR